MKESRQHMQDLRTLENCRMLKRVVKEDEFVGVPMTGIKVAATNAAADYKGGGGGSG